MMPRTSIDIHESGQYVIGPGLYAFVELFREVLEGNQDNPDEDPEYSNTLIGCYERDETNDGSGKPILYLAEVGSLINPAVGIANRSTHHQTAILFQNRQQSNRLQYHFLLHNQNAWPKCWESVFRTSVEAADDASSSEDEDKFFNNQHNPQH
jgi:hypothetical protein